MIFEIFKNKTILVTGHTGFKGSWLCLWLAQLGAEVHGYALPPDTEPNHYAATKISELLTSEKLADLRDRDTLTKYIHAVHPDCIFHLAAQPLVRKSYAEPVETFDTNVMGSIYVMEAVRAMQKPCAVIMITSDKCYLNTGKAEGYVETDPLGGYDPYSASKASAEIAIASWRNAFFSPEKIDEHNVHIASVRAGNVIGGGDWAEDRIIPDAVRAVVSGKQLDIRSPQAVRPWQHVLEPLSGYMLLAAKMLSGKNGFENAWNFGPLLNDTATVSELIDKFYEYWGKGKAFYDPKHATLHEAAFLRLSSEKSISLLGWKPVWSLNETLVVTANWYKNYYSGKDALTLSLNDIMEYTKKMEIL